MNLFDYFKPFIMSIAMLTLCMGSMVAMAGNYEKIKGQFNQKYTKQEVLPVPQAQGHMILLTQSNGKNTNANGAGYMHGAQVVISEIGDINQGNGSHSGYVTQTMSNGDETVTRFTGEISTTMTRDGQPNTTFAGQWEKVSGKGKYSAVMGNGTYTGYFTSETEYVVDYDGFIYQP